MILQGGWRGPALPAVGEDIGRSCSAGPRCSTPPCGPGAVETIALTSGTHRLSPIALCQFTRSVRTSNGKVGVDKKNQTLDFNSRHLSQATPTRWRFIVTMVLKSDERIHEWCLHRGWSVLKPQRISDPVVVNGTAGLSAGPNYVIMPILALTRHINNL